MPLLYLLRQPIGVDDRDTDGHTSLMWAAWQGESGARSTKIRVWLNTLVVPEQATLYLSISF